MYTHGYSSHTRGDGEAQRAEIRPTAIEFRRRIGEEQVERESGTVSMRAQRLLLAHRSDILDYEYLSDGEPRRWEAEPRRQRREELSVGKSKDLTPPV
jgi:hypothetical protein